MAGEEKVQRRIIVNALKRFDRWLEKVGEPADDVGFSSNGSMRIPEGPLSDEWVKFLESGSAAVPNPEVRAQVLAQLGDYRRRKDAEQRDSRGR